MALTACSNNFDLRSIQGEWTVNKELTAAPIVGISDEETAALIGEKLLLRSQKIQFQNRACEGEMVINHLLINGDTVWFVWYGVLFEADRK